MDMVESVDYDKFPLQHPDVGRLVKVFFHQNFSKWVYGVVVRDDLEYPHVTIIQLGNGKHVLGSECQYQSIELDILKSLRQEYEHDI
jgi:hypothetical protein